MLTTLAVIAVAISIAIANSVQFFAASLRQPANTVYLGTIHYYEDYFLYVNQFLQGARGAWLTQNQYTSEPTPATFLYWPNILLGKIGGIFGLTAHISYNIAVFMLSFITVLVLYRLLIIVFPKDRRRAFLALVFALTATSFMNRIWVDGKVIWYPFQLWKTPNFAFDRFGGVPHQLIQTLLFYILLIIFFKDIKYRLFYLSLVTILLTSTNPVLVALLLLSLSITRLIKPEPRMTRGALLLPLASFLLALIPFQHAIGEEPYIQSKLWEASQKITTTIPFLFASLGPVSVLAVLGSIRAIRAPTFFTTLAIVALTLSYILFLSPIPGLLGISNSRVIFPSLYVFWGALASYALSKPGRVMTLVLVGYLLLTAQTLLWEIRQKAAVSTDKPIPLLYLPTPLYKGLQILANRPPASDIVLANPVTYMDSIAPAITAHTGYSGHPLATIDPQKKRDEAARFFLGQMGIYEGQAWLKEKNIRYIISTSLDSGSLTSYALPKPIYQNNEITIVDTYANQ